MIQKAVIEVDEEGTVAAAATAVAVNSRSLGMERKEKMSFTVNHPFLFFLRDLQTGILLFQGRVVDPSGGHSFAIANCICICFSFVFVSVFSFVFVSVFHLYLYLGGQNAQLQVNFQVGSNRMLSQGKLTRL